MYSDLRGKRRLCLVASPGLPPTPVRGEPRSHTPESRLSLCNDLPFSSPLPACVESDQAMNSWKKWRARSWETSLLSPTVPYGLWVGRTGLSAFWLHTFSSAVSFPCANSYELFKTQPRTTHKGILSQLWPDGPAQGTPICLHSLT